MMLLTKKIKKAIRNKKKIYAFRFFKMDVLGLVATNLCITIVDVSYLSKCLAIILKEWNS